MSLTGSISGGVHRLDIRIYYEDTDHSGRVYHANYLKFCERGRSETLKCLGIGHTGLSGDDLFFVVRHMECDFRGAASIDDIVTVKTSLAETSGARLVLAQQVECAGKVVFAARVTLALVNAQGRPQRVPAGMLAALSAH